MTNNTKMVRDVLGGVIPQSLNDDGTYIVLANGDTTGINFSEKKLLRDVQRGILPYQYYDVDEGKFVPGVLGGGGGGTGTVNTVNNKSPNASGNVTLTHTDVGATSAQDLSNLSQVVTQNAEEVAAHLAHYALLEDDVDTLKAGIDADIITINIFNTATITNGIYIDDNNQTVPESNYAESDFIEVLPGEIIYQYNPSLAGMFKKFYDKDKVFITSFTPSNQTGTNTPLEITVPNDNNIRYMRTSLERASLNGFKLLANRSLLHINNAIQVRKKSKWANKKIAFLGDSITEGYASTKAYTLYLRDVMALRAIENYGIGGSTIADGSYPMHSRALNVVSDCDVIFVMGGTNDFANFNRVLGDIYTIESNGEMIPNLDTSTFYGGLHVMCRNLFSNYPNAKIVLATPLHREEFAGQPNEYEKNTAGLYLKGYVEAIKSIGEWYSIPVCDLWNISNLNPNISQHKNLYFSLTDGLHPNALGHERLAGVISAFLETI